MENVREIEETINESRKVLKKMVKELEAAKKLPDGSDQFRAVNRVKSRIIRFKAEAFDAIESAMGAILNDYMLDAEGAR